MLRIAAWCAATLFLTLAAAHAAPLRVGIVDVQQVLRDAKAAKALRPQMERQRQAFQMEIRERERELRDAGKDLGEERALLSAEAFDEKRRALEEEGRKAQKAVQERKRELDRVFNETKDVILKELLEVVGAIADEKKLDIVLEKRVVFLSANSLDLTPEIVARLDERLPSISLPEYKLEAKN